MWFTLFSPAGNVTANNCQPNKRLILVLWNNSGIYTPGFRPCALRNIDRDLKNTQMNSPLASSHFKGLRFTKIIARVSKLWICNYCFPEADRSLPLCVPSFLLSSCPHWGHANCDSRIEQPLPPSFYWLLEGNGIFLASKLKFVWDMSHHSQRDHPEQE